MRSVVMTRLRLIAKREVLRDAPTLRALDVIRFTHVKSSACCNAPAEPARSRNESLSQATRAQPGRLVSLGRRGSGSGEETRSADFSFDRVQRLPLVPRHGARELRK